MASWGQILTSIEQNTKQTKAVPPIHDVDVRLLRLFKAVVESEGFAAAEETLGVGRSTISKHVADLEARLGVRLCERGRSGFKTTAHGQVVYDSTLELLDALDIFRSKVSTAKGRIFGSVTLWVMDNTPHEVGNPVGIALKRFLDRPGKVELNINAASPVAVEEAVATRRANVGLTIMGSKLPGLIYRSIGLERTSLYCGSDHEIAKKTLTGDLSESELGNADFITRGYLHSSTVALGQPRRSSAIAYHVEGAIQLILTGKYIGVLPDHIAKPWVNMGKMVRLRFPAAVVETPLCVVVREKSLKIPAISALVDDLVSAHELISPIT